MIDVWIPTAKAEVVKVAWSCPLITCKIWGVPSTVVPSMKVTVPVGIGAPEIVPLTVAVSVSGWPNVVVPADAPSVVVVASVTTTVRAGSDDLADPAVVGIGDEQVPRGIHGRAVRIVQRGGGGRPAVATETIAAVAGDGGDDRAG